MEPTIAQGSAVTVTSLADTSAIRFGDVVVLSWPSDTTRRVKRIVGLPGDTLAMASGVVIRNGQPLVEPYSPSFVQRDSTFAAEVERVLSRRLSPKEADSRNWGPTVIPAGRYWALGDNRDSSMDSRHLGFVPREQIYGRVDLRR